MSDELGMTESEYRLKVLNELKDIRYALYGTTDQPGLLSDQRAMKKLLWGNGKMGLKQRMDIVWWGGGSIIFLIGFSVRSIVGLLIESAIKK